MDEVEVLLVDDDRAWAESTATVLEHQREAFVVTTATTLADAGESFAATDPDCVVCDYQLEYGTGFEFLGEVRAADPGRPFLLVTGEGSESVASDAISRQVTDYLPKRNIGGRNDRLARRIETTVRSYRAERALARERRSKEAMLDLVTATTAREELSQEFCEHLVAERGYDCAWIGTDDGTRGIVPRAAAGDGRYLDAAFESGHEFEPARIALDRGEPYAVPPVDRKRSRTDRGGEAPGPEKLDAGDDRGGPPDAGTAGWREVADRFGIRSVAAVPIDHENTAFGVLVVYTGERDAVDDRELDLLGEYGRTIAYALRTAEWKRSLVSATPVVVEFELTDEAAPLVALARRLPDHASLRVLTAAFREEGLLYALEVDGTPPTSVLDAADHVEAIQSVDVDESAGRCDLVVPSPTPTEVLVDRGGRVVDVVVGDDRMTIAVVRPDDGDVQAFADDLQESFPDARITSVRSSRRTGRHASTDDVLDALTGRQLQALELAYVDGYFERPREHNTTEIAAKLDVNRATFTQHLRAAERKVLSRLFDPPE